MKARISVVAISIAAALATAGCKQEVESTDIRTTGVYPVIDVTAEGTGTSRVPLRLAVAGAVRNSCGSVPVTEAGVTKPAGTPGILAIDGLDCEPAATATCEASDALITALPVGSAIFVTVAI